MEMHKRHRYLNIPTEILRSLVVISEVENFVKAGTRLGLSQPAISAQMKRLETIIGSKVFKRSKGGVSLTPIGDLVVLQAKKLLAANDRILAIGGADPHEPHIRLGLSAFFVDQFLRECAAIQKTGHLAIMSDHSSILARALKEGYLDVACLANPPADVGQKLFGWAEKFVWVKGPGFRLSPGRPIPIIGWPSASQDATMIGALEEAGLTYRIAFTSSDHYARTKAVQSGIGLMALPLRQVLPPILEASEDYLPTLKPISAGIYVRDIPMPEKIAGVAQGLKALLPPGQKAD